MDLAILKLTFITIVQSDVCFILKACLQNKTNLRLSAMFKAHHLCALNIAESLKRTTQMPRSERARFFIWPVELI